MGGRVRGWPVSDKVSKQNEEENTETEPVGRTAVLTLQPTLLPGPQGNDFLPSGKGRTRAQEALRLRTAPSRRPANPELGLSSVPHLRRRACPLEGSQGGSSR